MYVYCCFYKIINVKVVFIILYEKYVLSVSFSNKMIICIVIFVSLFNIEVFRIYLYFYGFCKVNKIENYK